MEKLWLNTKAVGIIAVGISLYAIILFMTFISGIVGSFKRLMTSKGNG